MMKFLSDAEHTHTHLTRRALLSAALVGACLVALPRAVFALTQGEATALVNRMVAEINGIIASGRNVSSMISAFEGVFNRYGDVGRIARSVMGPDWNQMSGSQQSAFASAFQGYMARKYGSRFRDFQGGQITVLKTAAVNQYVEVQTTAVVPGRSAMDVTFLVASLGGADKFFDLRIEGVSLLRTERDEIGAMLDQRRGNFDQLIADLRRT